MPYGLFNYQDMIEPMGLSPIAPSGFGFGDDMRFAPLPMPPSGGGGCPAGYSNQTPSETQYPVVPDRMPPQTGDGYSYSIAPR